MDSMQARWLIAGGAAAAGVAVWMIANKQKEAVLG